VIDVAMTRADLRSANVAVVIDVLRATSTATQALATGYRSVICAESIERAAQLRAPGRVLAGERHCRKPDGFDQGNSPSEATTRHGTQMVLATTNGAPAIVAAAGHAPRVLLACLLNLEAVLQWLRGAGELDGSGLQIVCSGTDGRIALEDVYVAGRLSAGLPGPRTDAALVAEGVARSFATPLQALAASADAAALRAADLTADIADCARESELDVVPIVIAASNGAAVVATEPQTSGAGRDRDQARAPSVDGIDVDSAAGV
jgi:2-phosphosulfolactate phosphatase